MLTTGAPDASEGGETMGKRVRWLAAALAVTAVLATRSAAAFCGFYVSGADTKLFNDATNVVLMREGTRTVLSMQNAYKGPPEAFAMVVPVPVVLQKENVRTLPRAIFDRIDQLAAPRLVEYWEQDPCSQPMTLSAPMSAGVAMPKGAMRHASEGDDYGVKIEAQFTVGEYEVVVLSADDSSGLERWLHDNHYSIPPGSEPYLRPYVQAGSKFFVAKVDTTKVTFEDGRAMLSPLRFHYDSDSFALPIRLGLVNSGGTQDLVINILARHQRYEAANYPNVTVPTNLDVAEEARDRFGPFYAALFDRTVEAHPKAVVTEYAWDSSSCDPCPVPALDAGEVQTLGGDVLGGASAPVPVRQGRRFGFGAGSDFVLTRLHARYSKESLGEDIVFRPASPIQGGREMPVAGGQLEKGSQAASFNNFQARYAIRHRWQGAVSCPSPRFGVWGGPPAGQAGSTAPRAAAKLAFVPRGGVELASFVREDVPDLSLRAGVPSRAPQVPSQTRLIGGGGGQELLVGPGALLGVMGIGAVAALLLSQRRRRV